MFLDSFQSIKLVSKGVRLPVLKIDKKYYKQCNISENSQNHEFLRALCLEGFKKLNLTKDSEKYKKYAERVKYEFEIIKELEFVDYILLVWTVITYCHENSIPVGRGRGSAASSLILYLIGVTGIDPIQYNLYFERFISKIRAKKTIIDGITYLDGNLLPDVDLDICYYKRAQVIKYVESLFPGKVCKIMTLNTLSGKLLIKECGKIVDEKKEAEMTEVSSWIPKKYGVVKDLEIAYNGVIDEKTKEYKEEPVKEFVDWCDKNPEIYKIALKLRDLNKNKGVHASGTLLSYDDITDSVPMELSSDKERVSGYDMKWVALTNIKLDLLGLRGVSVVNDVCSSLGIKQESIDVNDSFIYQQLQDLKYPHGLFQIEAETNLKVCQHVRPKNIEQLSAVVALARPGALEFVDQYALYTNTGTIASVHPFFDDILSRNGGVCIFQEELMKMLNKVGFSLDESEICRKIVGKKSIEEVKKWKSKIYQKVKEQNLEKEIADVLWRVLNESANYSFNASHAFSYASLAAITVYLKFKYPQQFYLSLLKMTRHEGDPISEISIIEKEMKHFGIKLLPPHIINSQMEFEFEGKNIRFGLLSVKGISEKSIEKLNLFRKKYTNKFEIFQAAEEVGLSIGIVSALIQAGALEGFNQSRSRVVLEAQLWGCLNVKEKTYAIELATRFDFDLVAIIKHLTVLKDSKGKQIISTRPETEQVNANPVKKKRYRYETIKKHYLPYLEIYKQNSQYEEYANYYYELNLMGYVHNKSLRDIFSKEVDYLKSVEEVKTTVVNKRVRFVGIVKETHLGISKKKNKYFRLKVSDETSDCTVLMFKDLIDECKSANGDVLPEEGDIVMVDGTKKEESVFADRITIQDHKIYTKLADLKSENKEENKEEIVDEKEKTRENKQNENLILQT